MADIAAAPTEMLKALSEQIEHQLIAVYGSDVRHALLVWTDGHADVVSTMEPVDIVAIVESLFGDEEENEIHPIARETQQ